MLVITRKDGEEIVIGEPPIAVVRVCDIKGERVRVGVTAHDSVPVHRREVFDERERQRAEENGGNRESGFGTRGDAA